MLFLFATGDLAIRKNNLTTKQLGHIHYNNHRKFDTSSALDIESLQHSAAYYCRARASNYWGLDKVWIA